MRAIVESRKGLTYTLLTNVGSVLTIKVRQNPPFNPVDVIELREADWTLAPKGD